MASILRSEKGQILSIHGEYQNAHPFSHVWLRKDSCQSAASARISAPLIGYQGDTVRSSREGCPRAGKPEFPRQRFLPICCAVRILSAGGQEAGTSGMTLPSKLGPLHSKLLGMHPASFICLLSPFMGSLTRRLAVTGPSSCIPAPSQTPQ